MKKLFLTLIGISLIISVVAQNQGDTIIVQTFNYNSLTRDTMVNFPDDPSLTFEKIIMSYNMRCKDNVVNTSGDINNIGCGAWDYTCNTYVHDSTRIDSILRFHNSHAISNFNGSTYNYSETPVYNYIQYLQDYTITDSVISENIIPIGEGQEALNFILGTNHKAHKSQFLYKANELASLGLVNDTLNAISLNILSDEQWMNHFTIKLKLTTDSLLSDTIPHTDGFTEVYDLNGVQFPFLFNNGINKFQFTEPFVWDSISNIIVELSLTNPTLSTEEMLVEGTNSYEDLGLFSNDANHITVNSNESIDIPAESLENISEEITVSFWLKGNEDVLPKNTTLFEGYDNNGNRTVNIHFPWSNGKIYWDCGNSGTSSYDRIEKTANLSEYTGDWSHWAFTKNTTTGSMKIFRNSTLWHVGNGFEKTMNIDTLKLASQGNGNGNFWDGDIKEVRVFNKEISENTIKKWMNKRIDNTHPNYSDLVAYYPLNEGVGNTSLDNTTNEQTAIFFGDVVWGITKGENINQFFTKTSWRPNINFYQGEYIQEIVTDTIIDSVLKEENIITEYAIFSNYEYLMNDSVGIIGTNSAFEAISYLFDENGNLLETNPTDIDGSIDISSLLYYQRYPMAFQIMSFVTPYGAGLDLGINGKTWYFDLTDFSPIFKGQKRINMNGGGEWQEDMDIQFLFIVGTPPRDVLEMKNLWRVEHKNYSQIMNDEVFEPREHTLLPNANAYKIRTAITGHGQQGEFNEQTHTISIDENIYDTWSVWKECAENPIFPQGGTWIYDRAGWCPGMATDLREYEITSIVDPGETHLFDYVVNGGSGDSRYWVSSQLVSYGNPNFSLDAAIVDILSPTNKVNYSKANPVCSNPKITIQNTGSNNLTSLTIEYWINNANEKETYTWNGNLLFLEKATFELPASEALWGNINADNNIFYVNISDPNNNTDEYVYNNSLKTSFDPVPVYPAIFELKLQTNSGISNGSFETSWEFLDNNDQVVYSSGNLNANQIYQDTVEFINGCYTFKVHDTGDDGISFWANNDGSGYIRFKRIGGSWLKLFEGDFGRFIHHEFIADVALSIDDDKPQFSIYPNPTNGEIIISWTAQKEINIQISNLVGEVILQKDLARNKRSKKIDLSNQPNGVYIIKINYDDYEYSEKILLNK